nr:hypothetical protein GCM10020092_041610 [Actinoplanes digitatis]
MRLQGRVADRPGCGEAAFEYRLSCVGQACGQQELAQGAPDDGDTVGSLESMENLKRFDHVIMR